MGILEGGNTLFLNVSCGKLVNKKKEISTFGYEGLFKSINRETDEFEGKTLEKIKLHMVDTKTGDEAVISFSAESWYAIGFFQRIEKIDLSKPFTVGVSQSEKNEKISFAWLKQGGKAIEKNADFPLPEKVKVGKTEIANWEKPNEIIDGIIEKMGKLDVTPVPQIQSNAKEQAVKEAEENNETLNEDDGLPF